MFRLGIEIPDLYAELRTLVCQIPAGRVATYGDLAAALGDWRAARWVADALKTPDRLDDCPDHRVVRQTGELAQYARGDLNDKARRLTAESVAVEQHRLDLPQYRFTEFDTTKPLARLAAYQKTLPEQVELKPLERVPELVAGVDVSYARHDLAVGAYVLVETATGRAVWSLTADVPTPFPYISGYLSFRELPVLLELLNRVEAAGRLAPLLIVDGNGILHPRRAGIATNLGVATQRATLGVSKKLLCGQVDLEGLSEGEARPITFKGEVRGAALRAGRRSRPVFVSPGDGIDVDDAVRVVRQLFRGHRLPEPTYLADALSRKVAQDMKRGAAE